MPLADQLPPPSLVALPGPVVAPGANVSLRCAGRLRGMSFALYRADEAAPLQYRDSAEPWADFPLPGARAPGTYSCYYHTPSSPYVLSLRSEPLVIRADHGESGAPRPGPTPAPQPGGPSPSLSPCFPTWGLGPYPLLPKSRSPGPLTLSTTTLRLGAVSPVSPWRLETERAGPDRGFRSQGLSPLLSCRLRLLGLHAGQPPPSGAGRPGAHLSGHTDYS